MAIPQQNVSTKLSLEGEDRASSVLKKAQGNLRDFAAEGNRAGVGFGKSAKHIQETSGDVESSLKSLKDFLPGLSGELNIAGDAGGAIESALRLIPGPAGLAVVGLTALTIAAYTFGKAARESAAAVDLLGDSNTRAFADQLDLGTKEAAALQAQMRQMPAELRPSVELLDRVGRNATRLGGEPLEAQQAFIAALAKGGDAVDEFEKRYGRLPATFGSVAAAIKSAGIDPDLLGFGPQSKSLQEQAATAALARAKAESEVAIALDKVALARKSLREASGTASTSIAKSDLNAAQQEYDKQVAIRAEAGKKAKALAEQVSLNQDFNRSLEASESTLRGIETIEDGRERSGQKVIALQNRQELIAQQLLVLERQRDTLSKEAYQTELKRLQGMEDQAIAGLAAEAKEAERVAEVADAKRRQRAAKGAAEAKRQREEERASLVSTQRAQEALMVARLEGDPATKPSAVRAKAYTDVLDVLRDTKKSTEEKAAAVQLIELRRDRELQTIEDAAAERSQALRDDALAADLDLADQRRQVAIDGAKERGDVETATQLERQAVVDKMNRDLVELERQANEQRKGLYGADLVNFEAAQKLRRQAVTDAAAVADSKLKSTADKAKADKEQKEREEVARNIEQVGTALQKAGGRNGRAMSAAAGGAADLARNWKDAKQAAPGIIAALGGVTSEYVDGRRAQAAVDGLMELALGTALSFVPGKQGEAAGHFGAAAIYGLVAGGLIGGGGGGSGRPSASGAGGGGAGGNGPSGPGYDGPETINIFYGLLGTRQEAGKAAQLALATIGNSGFKPKKAGS